MSYNLLNEGWIPTLENTGMVNRVGVRHALTRAGHIRQIAASNPMDNVALLRFLLAILHWGRPTPTDKDQKVLRGATGIPVDWLKELKEHEDKFNLLGAGERFYQDRQLAEQRKKRPIGDLLQEFPTETKIAHFRHVRDKQYGLCPACCALGIIRSCAFANYAGKGYTSAVNGPAPAYAVVQGETLLSTLLLNWPQGSVKREPPWLNDMAPVHEDLDLPTVFAWRSRRCWLDDPASIPEQCAYCGNRAGLITQMAFLGGWNPPFQPTGKQKKFWDQDPHLILEERKPKKQKNAASKKAPAVTGTALTTIGFPWRSSRIRTHAGFWRRVLAALAAAPSQATTEKSIAVKAIMVAGPAVTKNGMLYQDAASLSLPVCPKGVKQVVNAVTQLTDAAERILQTSTPNPRQAHLNRKAASDARSPSLETRLRQALDGWARNLASSPGGTQDSDESWRHQTIRLLQAVVEAVVLSTTPGSPLRRREAIMRVRSALDATANKALASSAVSPPLGTVLPSAARIDRAKPSRPRSGKRKGGST